MKHGSGYQQQQRGRRRRPWRWEPPVWAALLVAVVAVVVWVGVPQAHAFRLPAPAARLPLPPACRRRQVGSMVGMAAGAAEGGAAAAAGGVLERPPPSSPSQPMQPLPMVYLPATLASFSGGKAKGGSSSRGGSGGGSGGKGKEEEMLIPRDLAELCGHEMLVLRRQLRAAPARVVAEACSVSITGCGSIALAGGERGDDLFHVDTRESVTPTGRRGWVTAPLIWEGRQLGAITVKLRGLRGESAPAPRLLGPRESLLLQAAARRLARAIEEHPGVKLAEQARRRVTQRAKAQGSINTNDSNNNSRARRLLRRRSAAAAAAAVVPAKQEQQQHRRRRSSHHHHLLLPSTGNSDNDLWAYTAALLSSLLARAPLPRAALATLAAAARRLYASAEPALRRLQELDGLVWRLALPAMAALALDPAMHLLDTAYLSRRLGPTGLAAFALGERAIALASLLITAALSSPITPFVARMRGEGSARVAYTLVVRRLGLACALLGLGLVPALHAAGPRLLRLLGVNNEATLGPALEYFRIRAVGVPAILLNALAVGVFRGFMDTATPLVVAIFGFGLGYFLQPHWLPWPLNQVVTPGNELAGFGLTVTISQYAALLLFLLRLPAIRPPRPPGYRRRRPLLRPMLTLLGQGLSLAARSVLFRLLLLALSSAEVARVGTPVDVAAHQVALQLLLLPSSVLFDAFAITGQALVADSLGRHALARAAKIGRVLLSYGLSFGAVLSLKYVVGGVPSFITEDAAVLAKARPLTLILALLMPLTGWVQVCAGLLQGAQDYAYQIKLMVATVLAALPVLHLLALHHGLVGVWLSLIFVQGMRALGLSHRLFKDARSPLTLRREGSLASLEEKGLRDRVRMLPGQVMAAWWWVCAEMKAWVDGDERRQRREERARAMAAAAAQEAKQLVPLAF